MYCLDIVSYSIKLLMLATRLSHLILSSVEQVGCCYWDASSEYNSH